MMQSISKMDKSKQGPSAVLTQKDEPGPFKKAKSNVGMLSDHDDHQEGEDDNFLDSDLDELHHAKFKFPDDENETEDQNRRESSSVSKTRLSIVPKRPTKQVNRKCCRHFPCCLNLPLEIGIQILCVVDLVYCIASLVLWSTLMGMDLFAHKLNELNKTSIFIPPDKSKPLDPFITSTTTVIPPWTLRTRPTEIPKYDYEREDLEILSKKHSKIARMTLQQHEEIEKNCKAKYLIKYLFTDELLKTRTIWKDFLWIAIGGELIFILISILTLMCVCCFIEHRGSKLLVMLLWWLEWIPIFMDFEAMILSQTKRLCILEYATPHFQGQSFFLIFLTFRTMIFKPYQLLLHFCYIKELLIYGYLKDESINQPDESEYAHKYFSEFYAMEAQREGEGADAYRSTSPAIAVGFDTLIPSEVATVQNTVMTTQDDQFSIRNQDIRAMQSGKVEQNVKSVRHF